MAWTVTLTRSSIVTKRESTRHRKKTKQALGRNHIVSTPQTTLKTRDNQERALTLYLSRLTVGVRTKARQTPSTLATVSQGCIEAVWCLVWQGRILS